MNGPDTRYKMMFGGEWRPVTNMFDGRRQEVTQAMRAVSAVLYASDTEWIVVVVAPGDLVERTDRDPARRRWDVV